MKQLSNAELLNLVRKTKEETTNTPDLKFQLDESQKLYDDAQSEEPSSTPFYLPESPLTSTRLLDARTRHKAEKPLPGKEKSPFQLKLHKNPYGI